MQTKLMSIFFLFFIVFGLATKTKGQVKAPIVTKVKPASIDTLPYIKINKLTYYQHPLCLEYYALTDTTYIPTWYGAYCSLFNSNYFKNYPEDAVGLVQKRLGITKEKMEERKKKLESEDGSREKSMCRFTYIYGEIWLTYLPSGEQMIIILGLHSKEEIPDLTFKHPKDAINPDNEITDSVMWGFITAFIDEDEICKYADQLAVFNEMLSKHSAYQIISWNLPYFKDLLYRAPNYINSTIKDGKRMFETIERKGFEAGFMK